ncbi:transposase family protein, partial [Amycolatopsis regifaucium]
WISDGLPGAINDTAAARHHRIPDLAAQAGILLLADAGYHHITEDVLTPYKGRTHLPQHYLQANTEHSRIRCRGERGFATLKNWAILHRARCSTHRVTTLTKAILTLEQTR